MIGLRTLFGMATVWALMALGFWGAFNFLTFLGLEPMWSVFCGAGLLMFLATLHEVLNVPEPAE